MSVSTMKAFATNRPVVSYFALTFLISWGGVLIVVGPGGIPGTADQFEKLLPMAVVVMLAGPSVTGLCLIGLVDGRTGFRKLIARLRRWRVGLQWYAAALLMAPALMVTLLLALSLVSPQFLPAIVVSGDKRELVLAGLATAIAAGIFEELGWTGFATPRLRKRFGTVATGLIVGLLWAGWHVLVTVWAVGPSPRALALASYLLDPFLFLTAFRVLMVWVYEQTESVLLAILMHVSLTASARILGAPGIKGMPLVTFDIVWFAALWTVIAAITAANRRRLSRQPVRHRAA